MLNLLKHRLQQSARPLKLTIQGEKIIKSTLSNNEIEAYLEQMLDQENDVNIEEQDLSILVKRGNNIQIRVLECEQEQLNMALQLLFEAIVDSNCIVAHINAADLISFILVSEEMQKVAKLEATIIIGMSTTEQVRVMVLFDLD